MSLNLGFGVELKQDLLVIGGVNFDRKLRKNTPSQKNEPNSCYRGN